MAPVIEGLVITAAIVESALIPAQPVGPEPTPAVMAELCKARLSGKAGVGIRGSECAAESESECLALSEPAIAAWAATFFRFMVELPSVSSSGASC